MNPETRNLRPFFFLFVGMMVWWFAPSALRRLVYEAGYEFEAPSLVLSSHMRELGQYWEMRSRSKNDLIRAGRDTARLAATMQYEIAQNNGLKEENARLLKLIGMEERPDFRTVPARVVQRRLSMWWQQIILRKGKADGICVGCPVVNAYGVVGRVRQVFETTCVVELISSPAFRISATIEGIENCAVTYQGAGASPLRAASGKIADIPADAVFPEGITRLEVVTSGLGGIFPAGLKIGTVSATPTNFADGMFRGVPVELAQRLAAIEEAAILVPVDKSVLKNFVAEE